MSHDGAGRGLSPLCPVCGHDTHSGVTHSGPSDRAAVHVQTFPILQDDQHGAVPQLSTCRGLRQRWEGTVPLAGLPRGRDCHRPSCVTASPSVSAPGSPRTAHQTACARVLLCVCGTPPTWPGCPGPRRPRGVCADGQVLGRLWAPACGPRHAHQRLHSQRGRHTSPQRPQCP